MLSLESFPLSPVVRACTIAPDCLSLYGTESIISFSDVAHHPVNVLNPLFLSVSAVGNSFVHHESAPKMKKIDANWTMFPFLLLKMYIMLQAMNANAAAEAG